MTDRDPVRDRSRLRRELAREVRHARTLDAMARVPREAFLPPDLRPYAYENRPLPIAKGQTISQPLMVAMMTAALDPSPDDRILEIGTGSGYQAAVLAELGAHVVTVERIAELAGTAAATLGELGYADVEVHIGRPDEIGWPDGAPYDKIIVTAAAPEVPGSLIEQLRKGGRLLIPVGVRASQQLLVVTRTETGWTSEDRGGCRFVPLIGPGGWSVGTPDDDPG